MGSKGGDWIPIGAFAVGVSINVGHMSTSELEREAWLKEVERAKRKLHSAAPALTELADVYLRGDHPYKFLRDRLDPVFPEGLRHSKKDVSLSLDHQRLGPWLQARKVAPLDYHFFGLGLAAREDLTPWERDKLAANFHLSQREPGGYLHDWHPGPGSLQSPEMRLFERQLSGGFLDQVGLGDLLPAILEGGPLPALVGKAFEQGPRPEDAWNVATAVWMLARDADLAPWKAFCVEKAQLKFPDGDVYFPEWARG